VGCHRCVPWCVDELAGGECASRHARQSGTHTRQHTRQHTRTQATL
jgi:hypothetical protein